MSKKSVAILGAGPAGLAAAKECVQQGVLDVTVFEASEDVGGQWNFSNPMSACWQTLCTNSCRRMNEFSDFPWEEQDCVDKASSFVGLFQHHTEVQRYLKAYANFFGVLDKVKVNSKVTQLEKIGDKWRLQLNGKPEWSEFDFVIVCTGRQTHPKDSMKSSPQLQGFSGKVIHSSEFRTIEHSLSGKECLLIVGTGISGAEIATELATNGKAARVFHANKKSFYYMQTVVQDGSERPMDECVFSRMGVWINRVLTASVANSGFRSMMLGLCPEQITDPKYAPDPDISKSGVAVTRLPYARLANDGRIILRKLPLRCEGNKVSFGSGETEHVDIIVLATGFRQDFGFIEPEKLKTIQIQVTKEIRDTPLYLHTLVPNDNTICFVGAQQIFGPVFPALEMQGRYAGMFLSSKAPKINEKRKQAWIETWKQNRSKPGKQHTMALMIEEDIADELGISPGKIHALCNFRDLLGAAQFPCWYRTNKKYESTETAQRAYDRWQKYVREPLKAESGSDDVAFSFRQVDTT